MSRVCSKHVLVFNSRVSLPYPWDTSLCFCLLTSSFTMSRDFSIWTCILVYEHICLNTNKKYKHNYNYDNGQEAKLLSMQLLVPFILDSTLPESIQFHYWFLKDHNLIVHMSLESKTFHRIIIKFPFLTHFLIIYRKTSPSSIHVNNRAACLSCPAFLRAETKQL